MTSENIKFKLSGNFLTKPELDSFMKMYAEEYPLHYDIVEEHHNVGEHHKFILTINRKEWWKQFTSVGVHVHDATDSFMASVLRGMLSDYMIIASVESM